MSQKNKNGKPFVCPDCLKSECVCLPEAERKKSRDPKVAFPNAKHRIEFAFEHEGTSYFEFSDMNNVPCERGFALLLIYRELSMKCDTEFLRAHWEAKEAIYNKKELELTKLMKLDFQLHERADYIFEPMIGYKLCSCYYFDATENPYMVDWKYLNEKSSRFMSEKMSAFFLQTPIVKLIPYIKEFTSDFQEYCQMVVMIRKEHLEQIGTSLSETKANSDSYKWISSELQKISALTKSDKWDSTNTIYTSNIL